MNAVTDLSENTLIKHKILTRTLSEIPDFRYLLRLSSQPDPTRVLVVIHGISRQPAYMLRCLEAKAEALNYSLIAPVFNHWAYRDYQRLGRDGQGHRADLAFDAMLADIEKYTGLKGSVHLLGFSGGAQFAHRYVYSKHDRVRSASLTSAGWYTPLKSGTRFPYGTAESKRLPGVSFAINGLLSTPTLTLVGAKDTKRDPAMRQTPRIDKHQGKNRLERAQWFQQSLEQRAIKEGIDTRHRLQVLPNTGHDFGEAVLRGGLAEFVFNFCEEHV